VPVITVIVSFLLIDGYNIGNSIIVIIIGGILFTFGMEFVGIWDECDLENPGGIV